MKELLSRLDFRPLVPDVVIMATLLAFVGGAFLGLGAAFPDLLLKAAFQFNIGFAVAFLTVAGAFARRHKRAGRQISINVQYLAFLSGTMIITTVGFVAAFKAAIFGSSAIEGVVAAVIGHGSGILMAFAGAGQEEDG